jgi:hypothetical protein
VNPDELAALLEHFPVGLGPEIQLQCPRGHFIVDLALGATAGGGELPLIMWPAAGRDHHVSKRAVVIGTPDEIAELAAGNPGFVVKEGPDGLKVTLSCNRCPRWTLERNYQRLAVQLAVYALAGHPEYRL